MMPNGYECPWPGSSNNCGPSNHINLKQAMQNNNFAVPQESLRSFPRYQYPDQVNTNSSSANNTGSCHGGMSYQYNVQGSHQVTPQWSSFYQNSNNFGSVFGNKVQQQFPALPQTLIHYNFSQSWPNNLKLSKFKNQNVNYSQLSVVNNSKKTPDCSNKAQVNETNPKTPRIRVRDVSSVNNSVLQGMNTNLCEPPKKEPTNHFMDHLLSNKRVENNVAQKTHKNIPGVPEFGNLTKGCEYYELINNQPSTQQESVLINNLPNMTNWVPTTIVNLKNNTAKTNHEVLPASSSNPMLSNSDLSQSVCSKIYGKVSSENKRKILPKTQQLVSVGGTAVNTFVETQPNNLKSGFQRSEPRFSLPSVSSSEMVCSILDTNQNLVQRNQLMNIITAECDSSTVPSSSILPDLSCAENQSSIPPNVDSSNKKVNAVRNSLNENSFTTKPQCSPILNDPQCHNVKNINISVVINGNCEKPSSKMDKTKTEFHIKSKLGCSEPEKKQESLNNKQGKNQNFTINNTCKETLSNSSEIRSSVKIEMVDDSNSDQICLTLPDDLLRKESSSSQNSEGLTDVLCEPSSVEINEKESVTNSSKDSNKDVLEEWNDIDRKYNNKINRQKLDRLIEFLEADVNSDSCNVEENIPRLKRAREDDVLNQNRRKLRKSSIVKNKNKSREMTPLVLYKPCRKELTCSATVFESEENNLDNESKEKIEGDENAEGKTNDGVCSTAKQANEKTEEETQDRKKSPISSTKENFERKKKKKKRKNKEKDLGMMSEKQNCEDTEETNIISIVRAFQKLQYHHCLSCNLNSSNDSFWINVVSGELRCLNCFKEMAMRVEKTALKSKNLLVHSVHKSEVEGNNPDHGVEKKKEHVSLNKIKTKAKETTTETSTKHTNEEARHSDKEKKKIKSEENRKKHGDEVDAKEKSTGLQTSSDKHEKKKKEPNSTAKSIPNKTVDEIETKSEKHKKKSLTKYESEREMDKKSTKKKSVSVDKPMETTNKQNVKSSKLERTKQERKPDLKLKEKLRDVNSNLENKRNFQTAKKPEEKLEEKKKKEDVKESKKDSRVLLEKLYEKTKEVSLTLFSED